MSKDKIHGGLSDKMTPEEIAKKHGVSLKEIKAQINKGKKVEMEHVNDEELAEEIALDHLFEIPDYYTRLEKMEKEAKQDMNKKEITEGKENITEFARRMRELAGLAEGNQSKSLKSVQEGYNEAGEDYELEDRKNQAGINPEIDDFDTIDFEQEEIKEGENDIELYTLNENTVIVLDFLKNDEEE